jgi:hypothetical protein
MKIKLTKKNEYSLLPLIAISAAVAAPLLFILGLAFGANFGNRDGLIGGSISDWLTASATVAVTALTFILAKESWQLRILQVAQVRELQLDSIRPNININLEGSHVGMNFINVCLANRGKGIARNVTFKFYARDRSELLPGTDKVADKFFKLAIFRKGIESIGINQKISSYLFNFAQLSGELRGRAFEPYLCIRARFHDTEGNVYENEFTIDFSEFEGISEIGGNPIYEISTHLKKISEQLGKSLRTSNGRIGVDIFNSNDRTEEAEQTRRWIDEQRGSAIVTKVDHPESGET